MSKLIDVLQSWKRNAVVHVPQARRMNHFGQLYCPECQKSGRDSVLSETNDRKALTCPAGHRVDR